MLLLLIVASTQVRLESVRWWTSPTVVSSLGITKDQSAGIDRLYEASLPARIRSSEEVANLTEKVAKLIDEGDADNQLPGLTQELARARVTQCSLREQVLQLTSRALWPEQREQLFRLIAENRVTE